MAIIKAAARLILRERASYAYAGPVLCLGVPDIYLTPAELRKSSSYAGDIETDASGSFVSARSFFAALGLADITSIDIPGSSIAPDHIHDLNRPLPDALAGRFGLVVDPGTTEHVFDIRAGLSNIVHALRPGGVVVHFVPIYSYNGGYFSINPNVLHDFYLANGFLDVRSFVLMWDRYLPFAARTRCYPFGPVLAGRHALADRDQCRFTPCLLFFARRGEARDEIVVPIQQHAQSREPQPLGRLLRRVLPDSVFLYLKSWVRREVQLRRSRRTEFWI